MKVRSVFVLGLLLAGCATKARNIDAIYISPAAYRALSCSEIATEAKTLSLHAQAAVKRQDWDRINDQVATGLGVAVFWPMLFFVNEDGVHASNVSILKGQMQAIETASKDKGCNIQFKRI